MVMDITVPVVAARPPRPEEARHRTPCTIGDDRPHGEGWRGPASDDLGGKVLMPRLWDRAGFWLSVAMGVALLLVISANAADAQDATGLAVGVPARVANANGDSVMLREGPGYEAAILASFPEGTAVSLNEGPIAAADGSRWFGVTVEEQFGYMVVDYLAPTAAAPPAEVAPPEAAPPSGATVTTDAVNLRAEPSETAEVLLVIPAGTAVTPNGATSGSFSPIAYNGATGWVATAYLQPGDGAAPLAAAAAPPPAAAPAIDGAIATEVLNLRAGPSAEDAVLRVMPPGAPVTVTGPATGAFVPVVYNGTTGWADAAFLDTGGAPGETAGESAPASDDRAAAVTTESVNLRGNPSSSAPILATLPSNSAVETTGAAEAGFYPVLADGQPGWLAADYLRFSDGTPGAASAAATPAEATPVAGGSGVIWPVSGGTWEIMQGYNGSSHQNQDGLWQYYYSLDLVRADGNTAGQTVIAPASGTVRWTDPGTGGMSIDVGNGHALAFFHVAVDPSIEWGDRLAQGQAIGTISGPGGPGFAGTPHIHFTLWETTDQGNWSRVAAPFVGEYAISGEEFPDIGGGNQHRGVQFTP